MMRNTLHRAGVLILILATGVFVSAQNIPLTPTVFYPASSSVSPPLSDLPKSEPAKEGAEKEIRPHHQLTPHEPPVDQVDDALQTTIHLGLDARQQPRVP